MQLGLLKPNERFGKSWALKPECFWANSVGLRGWIKIRIGLTWTGPALPVDPNLVFVVFDLGC